MSDSMDMAALEAFIESDFPQIKGGFRVEALTDDGVVIRALVGADNLRPGGTVSGPSMFALADLAVYFAILRRLGPVALAVTTNASIDFMRKPVADRDLLGEARLLKLGRVLAVGDVMIRSEGSDDVVARASMTYSIPPR
ncbi:MAG: PaaI family thioesterase [Pseudomonadota bacterium]